MEMEAGRSDEKAYVAAVPSKKNLSKWIRVLIKCVQRVDLQCEEDEDLGPDACPSRVRINAEGLERGQDNKDSCPTMIKGERQMNEEFIGQTLGYMTLLHNVVNVLKGYVRSAWSR